MAGKKGCIKKRQGWIKDGIGYIPLTRGQVAKVDPEDVAWLTSQWNWNALWSPTAQKYYATCKDFSTGVERNLRMNRFVLDVWEDNVKVDHENHDTLDNRRGNLRKATQGENLCNRGKQANNTSGFKGVSWIEGKHKYKATITFAGKTKHLGYRDTPEEAAELYRAEVASFHGEFACAG